MGKTFQEKGVLPERVLNIFGRIVLKISFILLTLCISDFPIWFLYQKLKEKQEIRMLIFSSNIHLYIVKQT